MISATLGENEKSSRNLVLVSPAMKRGSVTSLRRNSRLLGTPFSTVPVQHSTPQHNTLQHSTPQHVIPEHALHTHAHPGQRSNYPAWSRAWAPSNDCLLLSQKAMAYSLVHALYALSVSHMCAHSRSQQGHAHTTRPPVPPSQKNTHRHTAGACPWT